MKRTLLAYSLILAVALGAAFLSWTHDPTTEVIKGVALSTLQANEWESILFETDSFRATLTRKKDTLGDFISVSTSRKTESGNDEQTFVAGDTASQAVERLAPFMGSRQIAADDALLEEFGLKPPRGTLTIEGRGRKHQFEVGKEGYGHRDYYVRDVQTGRVFLVDGGAIRPLTRAEDRLPERRLIGAESWDIEQIAVKTSDVSEVFEQRNREDRLASFWARAGSTERNVSAQAWIEKFLRMRSIRTAPQRPENLESVLRISIKTGAGVSDVELFRMTQDEVEKWYALSPIARGLVEIPMVIANDIVQDVGTLREDAK